MTTQDANKRALVAGALFLLTFISSIAGLLLYGPVLDDSGYVLGTGADTRIALGALCEVVLVIANIGTALALYPILRRHRESLALGYVASRIVESTIIAVGIVSVLSVVTLRQQFDGADASSFVVGAQSLVAVHDWTFLLGPAFCAGFGTGILLGYMMYKSGFVPRRMAMIGIVGGPLCLVNGVLVLFGLYEQTGGMSFLLTFPEIVWELSLGVYLVVKGLRGRAAAPAPALAPAAA